MRSKVQMLRLPPPWVLKPDRAHRGRPDERLTLAHEHRGRDITSEEVDALRRTADNVAVFVMSGPYGPAEKYRDISRDLNSKTQRLESIRWLGRIRTSQTS